jgi:hypothetical protein
MYKKTKYQILVEILRRATANIALITTTDVQLRSYSTSYQPTNTNISLRIPLALFLTFYNELQRLFAFELSFTLTNEIPLSTSIQHCLGVAFYVLGILTKQKACYQQHG